MADRPSPSGYRGIDKRADAKGGVTWHVAMRPGKLERDAQTWGRSHHNGDIAST
jgi:hypothetical protein